MSFNKFLLFLCLFVLIFGLCWLIVVWRVWVSTDVKDIKIAPGFPHLPGHHSVRLKIREQEINKRLADLHNREKRLKRLSLQIKNCPEFERISHSQYSSNIPRIYVITPTYNRPVQRAELTRLGQTLLHVPQLHWIVIEDANHKTPSIHNLLRNLGLPFTHLHAETDAQQKLKDSDPRWLRPRGVQQRNKGLLWLRENVDAMNGVIYFADDDNTYDLKIFDEMRTTKKVSVWPVGLVGKLLYESPLLNAGRVVGWRTFWQPQRPFAMDMAGFAVNLNYIINNAQAQFSDREKRGHVESAFLTALGVTLNDLEPKANNCTEILVWHTRTAKSDLRNEAKMKRKDKNVIPVV